MAFISNLIVFLLILLPTTMALPDIVENWWAQLRFINGPLVKGRVDDVLVLNYRKLILENDPNQVEVAKLRIGITSHLYLIYKITEPYAEKYGLTIRGTFMLYFRKEFGLCTALKWRQNCYEQIKRIDGETPSEQQLFDCPRNNFGVNAAIKHSLRINKHVIREANFQMFHYFFADHNQDFADFLKNFVEIAEEWKIKKLEEKFNKLFGWPRLVMLREIYPGFFDKIIKLSDEQLLVECYKNFFEYLNNINVKSNDIVKKWRLKTVLNYFIYKHWWDEHRGDFKDFIWSPVEAWDILFEKYWNGENILTLVDEKAVLKNIKDNFLDTEEFAQKQMEMPSYLEAAKEATEELGNFMKSGQKSPKYEYFKSMKGKLENAEQMEAFWRNCVDINLKKFPKETLKYGQKVIMTEGLMELMAAENEQKEGGGVKWDFVRNADERVFNELMIYTKSKFFEVLEERKMQNTPRIEASSSSSNSERQKNEGFGKEAEKIDEEEQIGKMDLKMGDEKDNMEIDKENSMTSPKKEEKTQARAANNVAVPTSSAGRKKFNRNTNAKKDTREVRRSKINWENVEGKKVEENKAKKVVAGKKIAKKEGGTKNVPTMKEAIKLEKEGRIVKEKDEKPAKASKNELANVLEKTVEPSGLKDDSKENKNELVLEESANADDYMESVIKLKYLYEFIGVNAGQENFFIIFGKFILQLYVNFMEENDGKKLEKLKMFFQITLLTKAIEEKFWGAKMLEKMGIFHKMEKEIAILGDYKGSWEIFKRKRFENAKPGMEADIGGMEMLLWKLWQIFKHINTLPANIHLILDREEDKNKKAMEATISQIHLHTFSLIMAEDASRDENGISILNSSFGPFKKFAQEDNKINDEFFHKLQQLIVPNERKKGEETGKMFADHLGTHIGAMIHLSRQQSLEKSLLESFKNDKSIAIQEPLQNWLNPHFFEISQPENSLIDGKLEEADEELKDFLDEKYQIDYVSIGKKENVKDWLKSLMKKWLDEKKMADGGFSMVLGGSALLDVATSDSDLDIIFILPKIFTNVLHDCNICKWVFLPNGKFCPEHDLIFGPSQSSFYRHLFDAIQFEEELNKFALTNRGAWVNALDHTRIPLIKIALAGVEVDIMVATIGRESIEEKLRGEWEMGKDGKMQLLNLHLMTKEMLESGEKIYAKSVLVLSGLRSAYLQKYHLIDADRQETFTYFLRALKLWAKSKNIYSNIFGYLSGTSLTLMATKICLLYPTGNLQFLMEKFFLIFSTWPWPKPLLLVNLTERGKESENETVEGWHLSNIAHSSEKMPIIVPMFPEGNTAYNVNEMGRKIIVETFKQAYNSLEKRRETARNLFAGELFNELGPDKHFNHFLLILCTVGSHQNVDINCGGWAKATIRMAFAEWAASMEGEGRRKLVMDQYHILTGHERKGKCWNAVKGFNESCIAWLVGIKFHGDNVGAFDEDDKKEILINLKRQFKETELYKMNIEYCQSSKLIESFGPKIVQEQSRMTEEMTKQHELKGKRKMRRWKPIQLDPNAAPFFPPSPLNFHQIFAPLPSHPHHFPADIFHPNPAPPPFPSWHIPQQQHFIHFPPQMPPHQQMRAGMHGRTVRENHRRMPNLRTNILPQRNYDSRSEASSSSTKDESEKEENPVEIVE